MNDDQNHSVMQKINVFLERVLVVEERSGYKTQPCKSNKEHTISRNFLNFSLLSRKTIDVLKQY